VSYTHCTQSIIHPAARPIQQWFPLLDSFAASITHSKTDRGQIHLRLVWTDANGITESGGAAAAPAPATEVPVAVDFASFAIPPDDTQAVAQQTAVQQTAAQNSAMLQQAALQQAIVAQQQQQQQQQQAMARQQAMMAQQQQPSAMMMQPGFMPPMAMMQPGMYAQPQPGMHALPMPMMGRYAGAHPAQPVTMHGHGGKSFKHGKFKGGKSFKKDKHKK
jgi:hypothetical protein